MQQNTLNLCATRTELFLHCVRLCRFHWKVRTVDNERQKKQIKLRDAKEWMQQQQQRNGKRKAICKSTESAVHSVSMADFILDARIGTSTCLVDWAFLNGNSTTQKLNWYFRYRAREKSVTFLFSFSFEICVYIYIYRIYVCVFLSRIWSNRLNQDLAQIFNI